MFKVRKRLEGPHMTAAGVVAPKEAAMVGGAMITGGDGSTDVSGVGSALAGVSPDQVTWISVSVVTHAATRYVAVLPHPVFSPPEQRTVPWRVDNHSSCFRLLIRQYGLGPAAAETVPCYGSHGVIPYPLQLDQPNDRSSGLLLQARPVGVPSLYYWQNGQVGRHVARKDMTSAAAVLVTSSLAGHIGGQNLRSRNNNSFGLWGWTDAATTVPTDDLGADIRLAVGRARGGAYGAVKRRLLRIRVYSDASTGPCNVIHVTDAPPGSEEVSSQTSIESAGSGEGSHEAAINFLLDSIKMSQRYERQGKSLLSQVEAMIAEYRQLQGGGAPEGAAMTSAKPPLQAMPLAVTLEEQAAEPVQQQQQVIAPVVLEPAAAGEPPAVVARSESRALAPVLHSETAPAIVAPGPVTTAGGTTTEAMTSVAVSEPAGGHARQRSLFSTVTGSVGALGGAAFSVGGAAVRGVGSMGGAALGAAGAVGGAALGAAGAVGGAALGAVGGVSRLVGLTSAGVKLYEAGQDVLWIQVVSAMRLAISDVVGLSDPFCIVNLESFEPSSLPSATQGAPAAPANSAAALTTAPSGSAPSASAPVQPASEHTHVLETFRTAVCRGTLDPVWGHEHTISFGARPIAEALGKGLGLQLRVRVYDFGE